MQHRKSKYPLGRRLFLHLPSSVRHPSWRSAPRAPPPAAEITARTPPSERPRPRGVLGGLPKVVARDRRQRVLAADALWLAPSQPCAAYGRRPSRWSPALSAARAPESHSSPAPRGGGLIRSGARGRQFVYTYCIMDWVWMLGEWIG